MKTEQKQRLFALYWGQTVLSFKDKGKLKFEINAPKDSQFAFFLDDGELYCGRGESIEDCKKQIDFIIEEKK